MSSRITPLGPQINLRCLWMAILSLVMAAPMAIAGPRLTFFETVHEFGDIWDVDTLPCEFRFLNTGDAPLVIEKVHPGCGCTTTTLEQTTYPPGASGTISATFKPNASGHLAKTVTVLSNDSETPTTTLYLRANVTPFVVTTPRLARMPDMLLGAGGSTDVLLTPADESFEFAPDIRTKGSSARYVKAQLLPPPAGAPTYARTLRIQVLPSAPWGDVQAFITVSGRAKLGADRPDIPQKPHEVKVTTLGAVHGKVVSDKTTLLLGGVTPGAPFSDRARLISRDGTPVKLLDHRISMRPSDVSVDIIPITDPGVVGYDLIVNGNSNEYMGSLAGQLVLRTDIPGEETLRFRTAGLVRYPKPGK